MRGKEGTSVRLRPPLCCRRGCPIGRIGHLRSSLRRGTRRPTRPHHPTHQVLLFSLRFLQSNSMTSRTRTLHTHAHVMTRVKKKEGEKKTSQRQRGSAGGGSGSSATRRCFLHSTAAPPKLLKHSSVRTGVRQSPQAREGGRGEELIAWPCGALPSGASSSSSSGGKRWPCVSPAASPSDSAQCRPESPSC